MALFGSQICFSPCCVTVARITLCFLFDCLTEGNGSQLSPLWTLASKFQNSPLHLVVSALEESMEAKQFLTFWSSLLRTEEQNNQPASQWQTDLPSLYINKSLWSCFEERRGVAPCLGLLQPHHLCDMICSSIHKALDMTCGLFNLLVTSGEEESVF